MNWALSIAAIAALGGRGVLGYDLVKDYSGENFFEGWDWYGRCVCVPFTPACCYAYAEPNALAGTI